MDTRHGDVAVAIACGGRRALAAGDYRDAGRTRHDLTVRSGFQLLRVAGNWLSTAAMHRALSAATSASVNVRSRAQNRSR